MMIGRIPRARSLIVLVLLVSVLLQAAAAARGSGCIGAADHDVTRETALIGATDSSYGGGDPSLERRDAPPQDMPARSAAVTACGAIAIAWTASRVPDPGPRFSIPAIDGSAPESRSVPPASPARESIACGATMRRHRSKTRGLRDPDVPLRWWVSPVEKAAGTVMVSVGVLLFTGHFAVITSFLAQYAPVIEVGG